MRGSKACFKAQCDGGATFGKGPGILIEMVKVHACATFSFNLSAHCNKIGVPPPVLIFMENLVFYAIVQLNLIFGLAGLVWPDKLMPLYGVLMFPWPASRRAIRLHGVVAIVGYVFVVSRLVVTLH